MTTALKNFLTLILLPLSCPLFAQRHWPNWNGFPFTFNGNNPDKIEPRWHNGLGSEGRIQVVL